MGLGGLAQGKSCTLGKCLLVKKVKSEKKKNATEGL